MSDVQSDTPAIALQRCQYSYSKESEHQDTENSGKKKKKSPQRAAWLDNGPESAPWLMNIQDS